MSLPQRPLLPAGSGMDDKSPRMGYPFPICTTAASTPSSVFPVFPAHLQQVYNSILQAQFLQFQHNSQLNQQRLSAGASPDNQSDQASSRSESPLGKKLILDEDGCATCPACGDKVPEDEWLAHVDTEKQRLIDHIMQVKESRCHSALSGGVGASFEQMTKRENELHRIRSNQQKRQILKRGTNTTIIRDCLTPYSRQSNDETGSSESPDTKNDEFAILKCSSCSQPCTYGIIMSSFDRPKCQMCFDIIRTQSCVLNSSSSPPPQLKEEADESPSAKKMKLEIE